MIKKYSSALLLGALISVSQPIKSDDTGGMSTTTKVLGITALTGLTVGSMATVVQWWNLGARLDDLQMRKKVGPLVERNVWLSPYDFNSGYALWSSFTRLENKKQKDAFRQQLLEEICRAEAIDRNAQDMHRLVTDALDRALAVLQEDLHHYARLTPMMLESARAVGFLKNPKELITSDYIIDYDIVRSDLPIGRTLIRYVRDVSLPIEVNYTWSNTFATRVPYWFTWTHTKAAECVFETLQQYARIRAIQRIMEQHSAPGSSAQQIDINLTESPSYPEPSAPSLYY